MEDRKVIHEQIADMLERINQANKSLSTSKRLLSVEIELLKTYNAELTRLIGLLDEGTKTAAPNVAAPAPPKVAEPEPEQMPIVEEVIEVIAEEKAKEEAPTAAVVHETPKVEASVAEVAPEAPKEEPAKEVIQEVVQPEPEPIVEPVVETPKQVEPVKEPVVAKEEKPKERITANRVHEDNSYDDEEEAVKEQSASLNDRFKKDEVPELGYKVNVKVGKNLRDMIDLSEKFQFARELFDGDTEYFERTIKYLNGCESFGDAELYLKQQIQPKFDWNGKEKMATKFNKLLQQRFN